MKKLLLTIIPVLLVLISFQVNVQAVNINARSYILIDAKTGQVLYEHNAHEKLYPASTTKIMTGIVAIENGDLEKMATVSQEAINDIGPGGMHMGLMAGEELQLKHLLNALMIQSANETSYVIAENISPTRQDFYNLMNSRAKELGAQNTNFLNPCGIDNGKKGEDHLTTASDLAKIARHAMTLPAFREIVQKTTYKVPPTNKHPNEVTVFTTNRLLTYGKYKSEYYDKITGIKTGYTDRAGYNLVSGAQTDDGMELIAVVMGVRDAYENVFNYSKTLLEYGFKNYSIKQVVAPRESISQVTVSDAYNPYLSLIAAKDIRSVLPNYTEKLDELIQKDIKINKNISAPIKEGDVLGSMEVKFNDVVLGNVDLIASRDVKKLVPSPAPVSVMQKTFSNPIFRNVVVGAIVILLLFTTLRITLKRISRTIKSRRTN